MDSLIVALQLTLPVTLVSLKFNFEFIHLLHLVVLFVSEPVDTLFERAGNRLTLNRLIHHKHFHEVCLVVLHMPQFVIFCEKILHVYGLTMTRRIR